MLFAIKEVHLKIQLRLYTLAVRRCPVFLYLREGLNKYFIPLYMRGFQANCSSLYTSVIGKPLFSLYT